MRVAIRGELRRGHALFLKGNEKIRFRDINVAGRHGLGAVPARHDGADA